MYTKSISLFSTFSRLIRYVTFMPKKFFFQFVESDLTENLDLQAILRAPVNGLVINLIN